MLREEFGFRLDAVGQVRRVRCWRRAHAVTAMGRGMGVVMFPERAVEFVMAIGVVVQHDAAGGRVDDDLLDAGDRRQTLR